MLTNEKTAAFLKALGHPVRLMIVKELIKGQKCVGEVETSMNIRQANASQHLSLLRIHGVLGCSRKGNQKYYFLSDPKKIKDLIRTLEGKDQKK